MNKQQKQRLIAGAAVILLLLGVAYYQYVWAPTQAVLKASTRQTLEQQLADEQERALACRSMRSALEQMPADTPQVADYDNLHNEIVALGEIFAGAQKYQLNFADAVTDGFIVRRNITIDFTASDMEQGRQILEQLARCRYRMRIRTLSLSQRANSLQNQQSVQIQAEVTFYEGATGEMRYTDEAQ